MEGIKYETQTSKWNWPDISRPPSNVWTMWRTALNEQFLVDKSHYLKEKTWKMDWRTTPTMEMVHG